MNGSNNQLPKYYIGSAFHVGNKYTQSCDLSLSCQKNLYVMNPFTGNLDSVTDVLSTNEKHNYYDILKLDQSMSVFRMEDVMHRFDIKGLFSETPSANSTILLICDGHGGNNMNEYTFIGGYEVAKIIVQFTEQFFRQYAGKYSLQQYRYLLSELFSQVHKYVIQCMCINCGKKTTCQNEDNNTYDEENIFDGKYFQNVLPQYLEQCTNNNNNNMPFEDFVTDKTFMPFTLIPTPNNYNIDKNSLWVPVYKTKKGNTIQIECGSTFSLLLITTVKNNSNELIMISANVGDSAIKLYQTTNEDNIIEKQQDKRQHCVEKTTLDLSHQCCCCYPINSKPKNSFILGFNHDSNNDKTIQGVKKTRTELIVSQQHNTENEQEVQRLGLLGISVKENYFVHKQQHVKSSLSRAIGHPILSYYGITYKPFIKLTRVTCGDIIIMASDGLWEILNYCTNSRQEFDILLLQFEQNAKQLLCNRNNQEIENNIELEIQQLCTQLANAFINLVRQRSLIMDNTTVFVVYIPVGI